MLAALVAVGIALVSGAFCLGAMTERVRVRPRLPDCDIDTILANAEKPFYEKSR